MKIASTIARFLMGFVFVFFGLNGILQFIPMPPPTGVAGQFAEALFLSHYLVVIMLIQVFGGILLIANRFVPLALTLLGPVITNIFFYHAFMDPSGLPRAAFMIILWLLAAYNVRSAFAGVLQRRVDDPAIPKTEFTRATVR
jgi:peptidoglycan biosynthesis protein MviN/MurJ (putative lipid II flippase)